MASESLPPAPRASSLLLSSPALLPPATLLRLPSLLQVGQAGRRAGNLASPAGRRDCRGTGFTIGTPASHRGMVKLWKARSVDLRLLLFSALYSSDQAPPGRPEEEAAAGTPTQDPAPSTKGRSGRSDALARRLAALLQPPPQTLLRTAGPLEWPGTFFPYQRDGIQALVQSAHLLLGDDMGLGKTVEAAAALRVLLFRREIERALVVVPASLLEQWRRELALWAPELRVMTVNGSPEDRLWQWQYRAHLTLASYETLRADYTGSPTCGPCRETWGVVILDEAQKIKNRDTDVARACKGLPRRRSWAMTGTPLENQPEDVLSILEFVLGGDSEEPAPSPAAPPPAGRPRSPFPAGVSLRAALSQYQLRRRKAEVLQDLPPRIVTDLVLPLTGPQRRAYERAEREGIIALREQGDVRIENVLALITRLKQICNFAPASGASAKMDDLVGRLEELTAEGHKALVFTQYTDQESGARRIAERLQRFSPLLYTGDMEPSERGRTVQRFQEEDSNPVMVVSLKAGGQGLNLQRASYVFHFDRSWNPAVEQQAEARAHRVGQTQPVHVYRYVMADTIEERTHELLDRKRHLFERIVDAASLDPGRLLDKRDLLELVGLDLPGFSPVLPPGEALEWRVAELLARQGYQVERPSLGRDGGIDVIAEKRDAVGVRTRLLVQCKDTDRPVPVEVVRSLNGVLPADDRSVTGVLVCPAGFTPEARVFAAARQIQLWDAARLERLERGGG